jgi:hypothetical protein
MKLSPAGLGAEPKKVIALVSILLVGGGVAYWVNRSDVPAGPTASTPPVAKTTVVPASDPLPASSVPRTTSSYGPRTATRGGRGSTSGDDFRPTLKLPEGLDVSGIDPTLKLDLLSKLRKVSVEGGSRSLFEFYTPPPPPPPPPPKVNPIKVDAAKIAAANLANASKSPPGPPPPPPIPLKFYGYSGALRSNIRKAFFLDGEDIVQAAENDIIRNRYKIIRIGVNSAEVEDTVAKNKQTLPLADEAP